MMITCKEVCDKATETLEGPTSLWQRVAIRGHLLICRHCRRFYQQMRLVTGAVAIGAIEEPTEDEIEQLVKRLSAQN